MAVASHWRSLGAIIGVSAAGALIGATPAVASPSLRVIDAPAQPETGRLEFSVKLTPAAKTVTVDYATKAGTASDDDFLDTSGSLRFKAGKAKKTIRVPLIDDEIEETAESMKMKLSSAHGAVIARAKATGTINDDDAPPNLPDFCRLEFPTTLTLQAGADSGDIFGRVGEPGLTDTSSNNDPSITSQIGYGPDGSDPETDPGWVFSTAGPNLGYTIGSPNFEAANDEHVGSFTAPSAAGSPYDFAYRFSLDGGAHYVYCDTGIAGSSDGYSPANAGQLTVNP